MIPGLDGLRAISVLAVILFHMNAGKFGFGWLGVQFFFVLSGFLITGILLRIKEKLPGKQFFYKFYGRRVLRIFPLFYFYLLIVVLLVWLANLPFFEPFRHQLKIVVQPQLPYAFFNVYDFFYTTSKFQVTPFLTHFWSLAVEEQFYLIWPWLIWLTPKKNLKKLFLITVVLGPVFRSITYFVYNHQFFPFLSADSYLNVYALPFSHIDAFALGAYVSQFKIQKPRKLFVIMACTIPLLGYFSQYLSLGFMVFHTFGYEFRMFTAYKFIWGYSLFNYLCAILLYNVYQTKLFVRILDNTILRYIGRISYGIYVYHVAIIYIMGKINPFDPDSPFHDVKLYLLELILIVVISSLSFYLLEKPIINMKDKLFPVGSD